MIAPSRHPDPREPQIRTRFSSEFVMVDTGVPEYSPFLRFFGVNSMSQTATIRSKSSIPPRVFCHSQQGAQGEYL
jgi:hypothetical protein